MTSLVLFVLLGLAALMVVFVGAFSWLSRVIRWELAWDWRLLKFGLHLFWLGVVMGGISSVVVLHHFQLLR